METDLALFEAAKEMDQAALVAIFDRYATDLFNYAMHVRDDPLKADDIVGEVFAKFLEQMAAGKYPHTNLRSHLYRITYRLLMDKTQFSQRESSLAFTNLELTNGSDNHTMASDKGNNNLLETLILALNKHLTANQRHVIILRFVEEFSLPETAEIVEKKVGNVKTIQSRAIKKLRKALYYEGNA